MTTTLVLEPVDEMAVVKLAGADAASSKVSSVDRDVGTPVDTEGLAGNDSPFTSSVANNYYNAITTRSILKKSKKGGTKRIMSKISWKKISKNDKKKGEEGNKVQKEIGKESVADKETNDAEIEDIIKGEAALVTSAHKSGSGCNGLNEIPGSDKSFAITQIKGSGSDTSASNSTSKKSQKEKKCKGIKNNGKENSKSSLDKENESKADRSPKQVDAALNDQKGPEDGASSYQPASQSLNKPSPGTYSQASDAENESKSSKTISKGSADSSRARLEKLFSEALAASATPEEAAQYLQANDPVHFSQAKGMSASKDTDEEEEEWLDIPPVTSFEQYDILSATSSVTHNTQKGSFMKKTIELMGVATEAVGNKNKSNEDPAIDEYDASNFEKDAKSRSSDASTAASSNPSIAEEFDCDAIAAILNNEDASRRSTPSEKSTMTVKTSNKVNTTISREQRQEDASNTNINDADIEQTSTGSFACGVREATKGIVTDLSGGLKRSVKKQDLKTSVKKMFGTLPTLSIASNGEVEMVLDGASAPSIGQPPVQHICGTLSVATKSSQNITDGGNYDLSSMLSWTDLADRNSPEHYAPDVVPPQIKTRNFILRWKDM